MESNRSQQSSDWTNYIRISTVGLIKKRQAVVEMNRSSIPSSSLYSILPEPIEPISRQFRIPDGMLDIPVSHVMLDRPGVMAIVGQLEAAPVTEHVRMDREGDSGLLPCPCHQLAHRGGGQRPLAFGDEDVGRLRIVPL